MCVHITNYHLSPDVHIPNYRVEEYSICPVNDRFPVMPAELYIFLPGLILTHVYPDLDLSGTMYVCTLQ